MLRASIPGLGNFELGPDVSTLHFDDLIREIQIHPPETKNLRYSQSCCRVYKNQSASWLWDVSRISNACRGFMITAV